MKYFVFSVLFVLTVSARAQVTLEHTYTPTFTSTSSFGLIEIDSAQWRYIFFNGVDSIYIFQLDHTLEKVISIPHSVRATRLEVLSKNLFDVDNQYEYMVDYNDSKGYSGIQILREDGSVLLNCDSTGVGGFYPGDQNSPDFASTSEGTKMIVHTFDNDFSVYSLPGKLPGCTTVTSGVNPSGIISSNPFPTSAYPNPSNGQIRIAYQLPAGTFSGEIVVTSETGTEMKRYRVTNAFSDLLIDGTEYLSGSYFYKLVTEKGESANGKFSIDR